MAKRMLNEEGRFETYREDVEASEAVFKAQGTTRVEVEALRHQKRMRNKQNAATASKEILISTMSDEELKAELEKRSVLKEEISPVIEVNEDDSAGPVDAPVVYADMTNADLQAMILDKGLSLPKQINKKNLIEVLMNGDEPEL